MPTSTAIVALSCEQFQLPIRVGLVDGSASYRPL